VEESAEVVGEARRRWRHVVERPPSSLAVRPGRARRPETRRQLAAVRRERESSAAVGSNGDGGRSREPEAAAMWAGCAVDRACVCYQQ